MRYSITGGVKQKLRNKTAKLTVASVLAIAGLGGGGAMAAVLTHQALATNPHPELVAQDFDTWDDSPAFKGVNVGFAEDGFGTITNVTVDITRADGSHVVKTGDQGILDYLSNQTTLTGGSAPIIIDPGNYTAAGDKDSNGHPYWNDQTYTNLKSNVDWDSSTEPTKVKITITGDNGTKSVTNSTFNQGPPSWPAYDDFVSPAPPLHLHFTENGHSRACGYAFNSVGTSPHTLTLVWSLPNGETSTGYKILRTFPSGATVPTTGAGTSFWAAQNIGHNYGAAPHDQGVYSYEVMYKDAAGRLSLPATCELIYDTVDPSLSILNPTANDNKHTAVYESNLGALTISGTATDATSGISQVTVRVYDLTAHQELFKNQHVAVTSGNWSVTLPPNTLTNGDLMQVELNGSDKANNHASDRAWFTVDSTRPTVTFLNPSDFNNASYNHYFQTGPNLQIMATDNASGVASTVLHIYNADNTPALFCPVSYIDTASCDTSGLAEGAYYVKAGATDVAGNNQTITKDFTIDKTAPTVTVLSPSSGDVIGGQGNSYMITVSLKIDDPAGVDLNSAYTWLEFASGTDLSGGAATNSQKYAIVHDSADNYHVTVDSRDFVPVGGSGMYELDIRAKDSVGNASSHKFYTGAPSHGTKLTIDNTAPVIEIDNQAPKSLYGLSDAMEVHIIDQNVGSTYIYQYANGVPGASPFKIYGNDCGPSADQPCAYFNIKWLPEGTYDIYHLDQVGNKSAVSTFTLDKTVPANPMLVSPSNGAVVNGASITQAWSDASTDVDHYIYESYNDAGATSIRWHQEFDSTSTSKTATNVAETTYWWRVMAVDKAGNDSGWSQLWEITVDNTAPVVNISSPAHGALVRGSVNINGTITDAHPDHYYLVIKDSHGQIVAGPHTVNQPVTSFTYNWDTTKLNDGAYTIDLEARDAAQNKDNHVSVQTIQVTVDNTAPAVIVDNLSTTDTTPTVTGTVDDPLATVSVSVNSQTYSATVSNTANNIGTYAWSADVTNTLAVGSYPVIATATDQAGNQGTGNGSLTISSSPIRPLVLGAAVTGGRGGGSQGGNNTNGNNGSQNGGTPQVLGATTTNNDSSGGQAGNSGNSNFASINSNKATAFLGLGWWWLAVLAAILALLAGLYTRATRQADNS